jgi:hypothetical protein
MVNQTKKQVGEAYAFFNCRASKGEIERELPDIRDAVKTPNQLELSLTEGINPEIFKHPELRSIAQDAKDAGIRYFMRASYRDASNKQTADELSSILNQAYQSPLYQDKEEFRGGIFFEENGHYAEKE